MVTDGIGIALLGISTLICDLLLQYVLPLKDRANSNKFQDVGADDDAVRNNVYHSLHSSPDMIISGNDLCVGVMCVSYNMILMVQDAFLNARSFDEKQNDNRRNDRLEMTQPTAAKNAGQSQAPPPVAVATPVDTNTATNGNSHGNGNDSGNSDNGTSNGNGGTVAKPPSVETQLFPNDNTPPVGPSPMSTSRPLEPLLPVGSDQVTLTVV